MKGIAVNPEADAVKLFSHHKSKAMNTNQKDPGCCLTESGCCSVTGMGCC